MKKVLIITYYWPPSGGVGAQRWLKMAKYLPQYGWQPVIFTPENPDFSIKDNSGFRDINPETEVIKSPIWEPYQVFNSLKKGGKKDLKQGLVLENKKQSWLDKLSIWLRGNMLIPDPKRFWIKPAARFLERIVKSNEIDLIVTTGPPHSMHLIGKRLKKKTGLPWIADFRDPWSKWDLLDKLNTSSVVRIIHKRLERKVLTQSDAVITVSNRLAQEFEKVRKSEVGVITNGYDDQDAIPFKKTETNSKFIISHVGLLNEMRDPTNLWVALDELCCENGDFKESLEVRLGGIVSESITASFDRYQALSSRIKVLDYLPHEEIYEEYIKASLLLLILNNTNNGKWILPSKLFEYIHVGKPVLMLGEQQSDSAEIVQKFEGNTVADFQDKEKIKKAILDNFHRYKAGTTVESENDYSLQFSRRELTGQLANLMNKITTT